MESLTLEKETPIEVSAGELFRWHTRPGAFERLVPPWKRVEIEGEHHRLEEGSRVRLRVYQGPVGLSWLAEHRNVRPGEGFEDVQVQGPFSLWEHRHEFVATSEGSSLLRDRVRYALPAGPVGALVGGRLVRRDMERLFAYRHATTLEDLRLHHSYALRKPLRVAVTGAGGLIGSSLTALLTSGGHEVIRLRRTDTNTPDREAAWNVEQGILEPRCLEGLDALVHLAGENIGGARWTEERKQQIRSSRVEGTRALVRSLARLSSPPKHFVCASGVGVYGTRRDELLSEDSPAGNGFLAQLCREWESAAGAAESLGCRVVIARFGVVLSPRGGALAQMLPVFRLGAGGKLGMGDQYVSWISIDDAAGALLHLLVSEDIAGPVCVTAPNPVTHRELTRTLGRVLRRPVVAAVPEFAARVAFGEMADELLLASTRAVPRKLQKSRYRFRQPRLELALRHLLGRTA